MYSSHNNNIKCIDSTIKYIDFESFHYTISLYVVSSFMVFSDFDYMFLLMYSSKKSIVLLHAFELGSIEGIFA